MIYEHLDKLINNMNNDGVWYGGIICYKNKTTSHAHAFVLGYVEACIHIKEYIKQSKLDIKQPKCYTKRKAHKK